MSYILDAILVLIILITVFISAKKGFVRTLVEVVGFVAAIFIAFTFSSPIASGVYGKMVEPVIVKTVENVSTDTANNASDAVDAVWQKMPAFVTESSFLGLSKENISQQVESETANGVTELAKSVSNSFAKPVITKLLSVLISVILVVALIFVVKIAAKYINKLFSFSLIGTINKTLGGILGLVKGVALAVVFCMIITLIISFTKNGFLIFTYDAIKSSYIFKFLAGFSPFI